MATRSWKVAYRAATSETDNSLLEKRISAAREAMMTRLITLTDTPENKSEIRAIEKALRTLQVIKWERLGRSS